MIRRINLIPEELRVVEKGRFYFIAFASLAIYISALYTVYQEKKNDLAAALPERAALQQKLTRLKIKKKGSEGLAESIRKAEMMREDLERKLSFVSLLSTGRTLWSDVLYEVSQIIPPDVWLTSLSSFDAGRAAEGARGVKLNGMAISSPLVTEFMAVIDASPHFGKTALTYAHRTEYEGSEAFSFELTFEIERTG